jgi:hypothetical protein
MANEAVSPCRSSCPCPLRLVDSHGCYEASDLTGQGRGDRLCFESEGRASVPEGPPIRNNRALYPRRDEGFPAAEGSETEV